MVSRFFIAPRARLWLIVGCILFLGHSALQAEEGAKPKKIVLLAGKKSHGPEGNGIHDYPWSAKLVKVMLDNSNVRDKVAVEFVLNGWPENEKTLDDAASIMIISDGRDGDLYEEAPHFSTAARTAYIERQIRRGCGFGTFHFSTFAPDVHAEKILNWSGGYFDWEEDGRRKWYSAIQTRDADIALPTPDHPAVRGVTPFKMKEEFYFNLRFRPDDKQLKPLLSVADLPGREPDGKFVAWAREREDGGRGFGTTCGHFYDNWQNDQFRRFILNALVWSAGVEVPPEGVTAKFYSREVIAAALTGKQGIQPAIVDERPIRVLLFAGNEAHKWHNWERTTPAIKAALETDRRIQVDISFDIEDLGRRDLSKYQTIVQNYCNWHDPKGLSEPAKKALVDFLQAGGGLVSIHFANGAFHFSLPMAKESDWPEYRKIVRRVWNHHGQGEGQSGHDAFGRFSVRPTETEHVITNGLQPFEVDDELYFRQDGDQPITPLIVARSKVTGRDEPLAWTGEYGRGRVFQTLLGHSEKTYEAFAACEILRRAVAWSANRPIVPQSPPAGAVQAAAPKPEPPAVVAPAKRDSLTEGKFGKAWDARTGGLLIDARPEQREPPLSLDLWVRVFAKKDFNIFVAAEPKSSPTHWELYSYAGSGVLSIYLPGRGGEYKSEADVCDGAWHHVGMVLEPERVRLYLDGKQVLDKPIKKGPDKSTNTPLAFGRLVEGTFGCDGLLDEVRLLPGVHPVERVPTEAVKINRDVIGLWRFDALDEGGVKDESSLRTPASRPPAGNTNAAAGGAEQYNHFGEKTVGFRWTEQDSVDDRWQQTDIGRFLASLVGLPQGPVRKGLSIRVGDKQEATVCYDTQSAACRGWWTGGFLKFGPQRFGIIAVPQPNGTLHYSAGEKPCWGDAAVHYESLGDFGDRVLLTYQVGTTRVAETPWMESAGQVQAISRTLEIEPGDEPLTLTILEIAGQDLRSESAAGNGGVSLISGDKRWNLALVGDGSLVPKADLKPERGRIVLTIPPRKSASRLKILCSACQATQQPDWRYLVTASPAPAPLSSLRPPAARRRPTDVVTQGVIGKTEGPFAVDTLTLPFENPARALMFVGGHDFFANGDIAVATLHGDVWRVSGIDDRLEKLTWRRFATGLFQPLGLKIVDDTAYVLGRDQITRLLDDDHDGEADRYENFCNLQQTSAGGHDYVAGLETDAAGNFLLVHANQGLVRVSSDGAKLEVLATGLRNPNGLGVGPGDVITVAPQEGNWTPVSYIAEARAGQHFGYGGPQITPERPLGYDPPLCWIPRRRDNSSGGQVWVPKDAWGPLGGQLLHLSFGQCRAMLVLRENVGAVSQGGTCDLPLPTFDSGVMRGRFNPHDGHLYLSGLRGWSSAAVQDGCLQRVRYTGRALDVPTAVKSYQNGLAITFSRPLQRDSAEDVDNYALERWNYRYSGDYGSRDYKASEPKQEGRDEVLPKSATLLEDGRTVFLELPELQPVMQLGLGYQLSAADQAPLRQTIYYTLNAIGADRFPETRLHRRTRTHILSEAEESRLKPGVLVRFRQDSGNGFLDDARVDRLIALYSAPDAAPSPFLLPKAFRASWEGYIRVPLAAAYRFRIAGNGRSTLLINDREVSAANVHLHKGYNRVTLRYESPGDGEARVRLLWASDAFAEEPVPPTVLSCRGDDPQLMRGSQLRRGRELFVTEHCHRCHAGPFDKKSPIALPEIANAPPDLRRSERLESPWLTRWIADPHALQPQARMPRLFTGETAAQEAADVAAYLRSIAPATPSAAIAETREVIERGSLLYENLGCIACHRFTPPAVEDEHARRSLHGVREQFSAGNLAAYLQSPHRLHPANPMPDFHLTAEEALALAAFVRSEAAPAAAAPGPTIAGDAGRGRSLFEAKGCGHCHMFDGKPLGKTRKLDLRKQLVPRACLAENPPAGAAWPVFALSAADRDALVAVLTTDAASLTRDTPVEASQRLFQTLRCGSCHDRDQRQSPRGLLMLEEGSQGLAPEVLPNLTWAGEKLHAPWTANFLAGKSPSPVRTWLKGRMPSFPQHAQTLAVGLAAEHGSAPTEPDSFAPSAERAELGKLLLEATALDCRQCHGVGKEPPRGDKETLLAPGVNFALVRERVRHDYFTRFLLDPPRYDVGSRMPKLAPDGRTTKVQAIHNGDAVQQFESIWHFLRRLE